MMSHAAYILQDRSYRAPSFLWLNMRLDTEVLCLHHCRSAVGARQTGVGRKPYSSSLLFPVVWITAKRCQLQTASASEVDSPLTWKSY